MNVLKNLWHISNKKLKPEQLKEKVKIKKKNYSIRISTPHKRIRYTISLILNYRKKGMQEPAD